MNLSESCGPVTKWAEALGSLLLDAIAGSNRGWIGLVEGVVSAGLAVGLAWSCSIMASVAAVKRWNWRLCCRIIAANPAGLEKEGTLLAGYSSDDVSYNEEAGTF